MRYEGSAAGTKGEGNDCRLDAGVLVGDAREATEDGRDGKSCESLSEAPDVFLRRSGGRADGAGELVVGEPTRKAEGTVISEDLLLPGEPIWRGEGTPSTIGDRMSIRVCAVGTDMRGLHRTVSNS
jgi:hypothetical protein